MRMCHVGRQLNQRRHTVERPGDFHGPDAIRVGLITGFGEVADIRDFTALDVADRAWFELVSVTETRATIVLMLEGLGVSHVFYYDTLGSGSLVVEVDGVPVS